ncbi:MAG: DUF4126 domain-containing protein [Elainella sp.]
METYMGLEHFANLDTLISLMLGISLSAATGFRVFVPLLVMSAAAVLGHVDLPSNFDWIESDQALILFAVASLLEIIGYYIPWLDHTLDIISTPAAIIAGTIVTASTAPEQMNPLVQWTTALLVGGGAAGLTKGMSNIMRVISTAISGGLTNPIVATIELALALGLALLAVSVPVVALLVVIALWSFAIRRIRRVFRRPEPADAAGR